MTAIATALRQAVVKQLNDTLNEDEDVIAVHDSHMAAFDALGLPAINVFCLSEDGENVANSIGVFDQRHTLRVEIACAETNAPSTLFAALEAFEGLVKTALFTDAEFWLLSPMASGRVERYSTQRGYSERDQQIAVAQMTIVFAVRYRESYTFEDDLATVRVYRDTLTPLTAGALHLTDLDD